MLIAICGAGFLVCILAILLLIISYIRSKSFLLPGLMFLLGFVAIVGSLVLKAGGFWEQAPEDETNTAPITDDAGEEEPPAGPDHLQVPDASDPPAGEETVLSLDAVCAMLEIGLGDGFSGKTVTNDGASIFANVWLDGLAKDLYTQKESGDSSYESWENAKSELVDLSNSLRELSSIFGYEDTSISLSVLNDQNHENTVLSILDGEIVYDALAEDPPAPKTSRTTTSTTRQQPAPVPAPAPETEEIPAEPEPEVQPDPEPAAVPLVESTGPQLPPDEPGISGAAAKPVSSNPQLPPDGQESAQTGNDTGTAAKPANGPELPGSTSSTSGNADNFNTYDNPEQQNTNADYILNSNTKKFHYPWCDDVKKIAPENYHEFWGTRLEAENLGYSPCGHCNP